MIPDSYRDGVVCEPLHYGTETRPVLCRCELQDVVTPS